MNIIFTLISNWVVLMVVAGLWTGAFYIEGVGVALLAAVILTLVNTVIRPILVFLTFPITLVTLGLFLFVINALTLMLTAYLVQGFTIDGFWVAFGAGIVISILNYLIQVLIIGRFRTK